MPEPPSPKQVLEKLMRGTADLEWQDLHELYSEDTVVDHPFALPAPRRTEGREAIRKHFAEFAAAPLKLQVRSMVVHATAFMAAVMDRLPAVVAALAEKMPP